MASVDHKRTEEHGGLSVARSEFASSLARRLEAIEAAVLALEQQRQSAARRDNLIRRLHALGASAKILGFAAAAESLSRAEQQLRTGLTDTLADDLSVVKSQIANLPTLVLRGTYSMLPAPPSAAPGHLSSPVPSMQGPWCVLVCGNTLLADTLRSAGAASSGFELIHTSDVSRLRDLCVTYGPDVVVLDRTIPSLKGLLQNLKEQPETAHTSVVVAHSADTPATALPELGGHAIVTTNVTPVALWRAVNRFRHEDYVLPPAREPLGDVDVRELCERAARELKRGLLDAADAESQSSVVSLGEGTEIKAAIWAAVARIRDILTTQSDGRIRFGSGPDGGVVLASSVGTGTRGRAFADCSAIDLTGKRIVVADDDPAITWVVGGTLRAAGADVREVHDGRRALSLVHHWWPELIVSDVLMPGMDGFALCREIKRDVALRDVPVILLSWKEDLLFRLRELGADADAYLRKEASTSALVERAKELLWPRISLERRLQDGNEVRGRLDGITPRTLVDLACKTDRNLRIMLRDATSHYDLRIRDRSLRAVNRTRGSGTVERGQAALSALLGVSAGRFSVVLDDQTCDNDFTEPTLDAVLRTPILRARAAQRVLSGAALALVEQLTLDPDAFVEELSLLPLSLRPIVDELLRGTAPRQLLASGATSLRALESLLSDAARRGAIRSLAGPSGEDLLTQEILALSAPLSEPPALENAAAPALFTFQLSPTPPPVPASPEPVEVPPATAVSMPERPVPTETPAVAAAPLRLEPALGTPAVAINDTDEGFDWAAEASWDVAPDIDGTVKADRASPFSRPRFSAEWGAEKRTSPGVGNFGIGHKSLAAVPGTPTEVPVSLGFVGLTAQDGQDNVGLQSLSKLSETPELSQVIVQPAAEEKLGQNPPGAAALESGANTSASPAMSRGAETDSSAKAAALPEIDLVVAPPRPTPAVELQRAAENTDPKNATPSEEEAIFPLLPSAAPEKRSSPRNTPVPLAAAPVAPCNTLPSELGPRVGPSELTEEIRSDVTHEAISSTDDHREYPLSAESIITEAPSGMSITNSDAETVGELTQVAPIASPATPPNRSFSRWLVRFALMFSTGGLAFVVALPIMRSCANLKNSATSASAAASQAEAPALTLSAANEAPDAPSVAREVSEVPLGVAIAPDKGLVVVKTGGVHSIFVDDEFVGRGPERVVTLNPGVHKVRASLNGEEHTETVNAMAGRAVELSLEHPGN